MANYTSAFNALKASINTRITVKDTVNSIDPVDVGGSMTDMLDLILPIANIVNGFGVLYGTIPPTDAQGTDNALYFEYGTQFQVWKRENLSAPYWNLKATGDLGITVRDGNINVQVSVNEDTVTASAGQWGLDNVVYEKITQTSFTVPASDLNFDRIDLVSGDIESEVNYTEGVASITPAEPAIPSNNVRLNFVYVPSTSSGDLPYILDSNAPPVVPPQLSALTFTNADLTNVGEDSWILEGVAMPTGRIPLGVLIQYEAGGVEYLPGGNLVDGVISGFTNNNTSIIKVKLG